MEGPMKRHLTLVSAAVVLGFVGWGQFSHVHADEVIPKPVKQTLIAVNAVPGIVLASDATDAQSPAVLSRGGIEPLAVADQGEVPESDRVESSGTNETSIATDSLTETSDDETEVEVIRERYPNRAVKIEREVTQDAEGNYVNHGSWKMWDAQGSVVAEGQYHFGQRVGVWNRWYRTGEVELLKTAPYSSFQGPFISQASFDQDQLNGKWCIFDSHQHKISEFEFADGERHGNFTWWFSSGQKMRECHYDGGELNGQFLEWGQDSRLILQVAYEHGRRLGSRAENYPAGGKKSDGLYLFAKEVVQTPDDWWNAKPAAYTKQGNDERHGHWIVWYSNGQKEVEGEYDHDIQVGEFTWWHANGQRTIQGEYRDGEQQGRWVWWHENGQKSIQGEFKQGHPIGKWTWWNEDGKVARASEMAQGAGEVVEKTPAPLPSAVPPAARSANRPSAAPGQPRPAISR